ncbi:MAG: UxaA family hydrolase, partial [Spirochaetota bacterium]
MNAHGLILVIRAGDSVAVALKDICKDTAVSFEDLTVISKEKIPAGHKIALRDIAEGEPIIKYGNTIGTASRQIIAGGHVHTHNLHTSLSGSHEYSWQPSVSRAAQCSESLSFSGY